MKTTRLFAAAALLPLLFSCAKEEIKTNDTLNGDGQKYDFTITVTGGGEDSITKASLSDDEGLFWVTGGKAGIVKNDGETTVKYESKALEKTYLFNGYNQASFAFTETYAGEYKFFYPYHSEATLDKIPFWVDPNQKTSAGSSSDCFALVSDGMVSLTAENHDIAAETTYKVVGSYIKFLVYKEGQTDDTAESVKYIITKGADRTVSGRYFVDGNDNTLRSGETDLKGETITLTVEAECKTTADAASAKGLYVAVLPESSQNTYTVITDNGFYLFASASAKDFNFGAIKNIPLNLTSSKAVKTAPEALYVVGDATTAGWTAEKAIALTKVENENKYKIENIPLVTGGEGFKFLTKQGDWQNPLVNAGDNKLAYYVGFPPSDKDKKFTVDKNGCYDLVVDFDTFTVTTTFKKEFPEVRSHNQEKTYEMLPTGNEGEFKAAAFLGYGGGYHDFYIYEGENTYHESEFRGITSFSKDDNYTYTGSITLDAATNKGWYVEDNGYRTPRYYDITLNTSTNTVTVKFAQGKNFWLIGDPFGGFNAEKKDEFKATADENGVVTWEVTTTNTGEWKICGEYTLLSELDKFWEGEWYYSTGTPFEWNWDAGQNGETKWEAGNNYTTESDNQNGFDVNVFCGDQKWKFNEKGTFRITFDSKNLTIKVEKL